ncbi:thioesterase family protein [Parageobacillus toebii]|uniref:acyl-CoA thioesterase n=1 Tax=Parageobacillus toebii TaxID=153151 RepID=UPI002E21E267|nr:thioesterase family protein [Parageobacillus toebii]
MEYQFKVNWGDTDAAGIVFYPNFYKWMDQATHHYFSKLGFSTWKLFHEDYTGIPIVEAKCRFQSPLFFEDEVCVKSAIVELRDKVFKIQHQFFKGEQMIAEGYEIRVWANFKNGKPKAVPIPDEIREKMKKASSDNIQVLG